MSVRRVRVVVLPRRAARLVVALAYRPVPIVAQNRRAAVARKARAHLARRLVVLLDLVAPAVSAQSVLRVPVAGQVNHHDAIEINHGKSEYSSYYATAK